MAGKSMQDPSMQTPLLSEHKGYHAVAQCNSQSPAAPRRWHGALLNCFGDCGAVGCGSCLLGRYCSCVVFGLNRRRALGTPGWLAGVGYFCLFSLATYWGFVALTVTSHLVLAQCNGDLPHPPLAPHKPLHPEWGPAMVEFYTSHNHNHTGPSPSPTPECRRALALNLATIGMILLMAVLSVVYAARQRTLIRRRFGIPGSCIGDLCTWCWCSSCALCQETRTLWHNNVEQGVWFGPTRLLTPPMLASSSDSLAPTIPHGAPPSVQQMSNIV